MLYAQINRRTALLCALVSGVLTGLAFNGFGIFCAWFCLVPLLFVLGSGCSFWTKLGSSFLFALVFYGLGLYWIGYVSVFGAVLLCVYLAFIVLYFAEAAHCALRLHRFLFFIAVPFLWCAFEKSQEFFITAFPWLKLAYTVVDFTALSQIACITSASGLSFCVVLANVSVLAFVLFFQEKDGRLKKQMLVTGCAGFALIAVLTGVGFFLLSGLERSFVSGRDGVFRIAAVQGNCMPEVYGGGTMEDVEKSLEVYKDMTVRLLESEKEGVDLVVWPETAVPADFRYWLTYFRTVHNLSMRYNVPFLIGSADEEETQEGKWIHRNTAFLYNHTKGIVSRYDKMKLVPFGEFLPFPSVLGWMRRFIFIPPDMTPGPGHTRFRVGPREEESFGALICFEDMFPSLSRETVNEGAGFLINITHDGWFRNSCAALQHRDGARLRAVENRRTLVRVTLSGVSCLIDPAGRVVSQISDGGDSVMVRGAKVFNIEKRWLTTGKSFYTRYGDLLGAVSLIFAILIFIVFFFRRPKNQPS